MIEHPIQPIFDKNSTLLILGSFPSEKSREQRFFYGHPQNRFWKVIAGVFEEKTPETIEEKTAFLRDHHIALWDVVASCDIVGSSDHSITNVTVNNFDEILSTSNIKQIFVNGKTAEKYYNNYVRDTIQRDALYLPSTSPANAAWSLERLMSVWKIIKSDMLP